MKRFVLVFGVIMLCAFTSVADITHNNENIDPPKKEKQFASLIAKNKKTTVVAKRMVDSIYGVLGLEDINLNKSVFEKAYSGYVYLLQQNKINKPGILTIADYSQPSSKKRLYVIDVANGRLLYNTYVAHGKNSGTNNAVNFSNTSNSNMSSLGFVLTGETYVGSKGYSLRLDGLEPGFNDNVRNRAVVMHGSSYVDANRAKTGVMMGRSFGCPALSWNDYREVIDEIKGGSLMFMYAPDAVYETKSPILNADFDWAASGELM